MIAGILLFGLSDRNSGVIWSLLPKLTRWTSYGSPVSSSMIDTLTPLGVGSEYSCRRSGCCAGHFFVMGKSVSAFMAGSIRSLGNPRAGRGDLCDIDAPQSSAAMDILFVAD